MDVSLGGKKGMGKICGKKSRQGLDDSQMEIQDLGSSLALR